MPTPPTPPMPRFGTRVIDGIGGALPRARVVLQDSNGPCPLIALANCLALRGELAILPSAADGTVGCSELLQALAAYAMERLDARRHGADADGATADVIDCLPRLVDGMDINVRFTAPDAYEATRELAVFDALGVRLLHGWVADRSADGAMAELLHRHSYNTLVEALIGGAAPPPPEGTPAAPMGEGAADQPEGGPADQTAPAAQEAAHGTALGEEEEDSQADPTPPLAGSAPSAPAPAADVGRALVEAHASAARDWLDATSGQLSFSGIIALQRALHGGEVAVLFRGGHYAVVAKVPDEPGIPAADRGRLVLLVTDEGMASSSAHGPVVWETLEDCDGSGTRFLPRFPVAAPPPQQHRRVVQAVAVSGDEPARLAAPVGTVVHAQSVHPPQIRTHNHAATARPAERRPVAPHKKKSKDSDCIVA